MREDQSPTGPAPNRAHGTADLVLDSEVIAPASVVDGEERQARGVRESDRGSPGAGAPPGPGSPESDRSAVAAPARHDRATPPRKRDEDGAGLERPGEETQSVKSSPDPSGDTLPVSVKPVEASAPAATNGHAQAAKLAAPPAAQQAEAEGVVAACVLLAGGLKPSQLTAASGLSVLDLPIAPDATLMDHWLSRLAPLMVAGGGVRVVHCNATPAPSAPRSQGTAVEIRRDVQGYRGPAGVARDVCADLDGEAHVLIAEGARHLGCDLGAMAAEHIRTGADITVAANPDGSPAGVYIARRGTLDIVPARGFMDLKEQWLSRAVGRGMSVWVFALPAPGALPLRTRAQLLRACFAPRRGPHASPWLSQGFTRGVLVRGRVSNLIAPGAEIDPGALLAHTIAMPGARVEAGAVVARSILCPGARVGPGEEVIDAVVTADGAHLDGEDAPRGAKERAR